ncbi:calcium binding EGF domain protein [Oesophagostomum dentatum]|uniref:Calcium binding EGF domain protein n=1 Tax=Oesophagostomum dentatum TaxID=61180 RepID=A0A0B1S4Z4_OESDE|nr:calcium binding EGF domain protein [Oesophagostomum dentatum]
MAAYRGDGKHCTYVGLGRSSLDCQDCSPDATCENGICQCKEGFEGDGFNCTDVNECLRAPYLCDKNAECMNREGSFICTCLPGFAGNGYNCTKTKSVEMIASTHALPDLDSLAPYIYKRTTMIPDRGDLAQLSSGILPICQAFWYDGCKGRSRNIFSDLDTCEQMCEATNILTRAAPEPTMDINKVKELGTFGIVVWHSKKDAGELD